ncbi:MAG: sugar transferase [Oryzomonas sp.]|uniref:sugar transferase n=1 Tax=Oryzomonas sp. TaxID=2855186 RepID=UPI0028495575|nr:sugar transferase [Oryzomonas sp.]MDR3579660.1 sugar transferase [Oryzomonas sp.]
MTVNGETHAAISAFTGINAGLEQEILDEEKFKRVLSRERKRAERSGEPLLLMLFDLADIVDRDVRAHAFAVVTEPIPGVIRQTDVCGWLNASELLGILFTDIARNDVKQAIQTVESKVRGCIKAKFLPSVYQKIRLSVLVFPDAYGGQEEGDWFNPLFYPEIYPHDTATRVAEGCKRFMDLVGSFMALLLLSPLFLVIAVLVKLTSPGQVFFRQVRVGQYGRLFTILKFRSMQVNNNDSIHREYIRKFIVNDMKGGPSSGGEGVVYKMRDDPRITPIGNFLRKSSLDELPQFFNVLKGEMSMVGPRPPIPYEVENYAPWHRYRIFVRKPGITGLWQVKGRSMTTFDDMVRLDLQYSRTWSLWLDIKLLLATPGVVIRGKGAY